MSNLIYMLQKYWRKHKKSAFSLLFAGVLMTAVITTTFLQLRMSYNRELHHLFDLDSMADLTLFDVPDDFLTQLTDGYEIPETEVISVIGKVELDGAAYACAYAEDDLHLLHAPLECGRFPSAANEVAIDRGLLNLLNWSGKPGDSIQLGETTYTLVGIIDAVFGSQRITTEINMDAQDGDVSPTPLPVIYVGKPQEAVTPAYQITLYRGVITDASADEGCKIFGLSEAEFSDRFYARFGEDTRWKFVQSDVSSTVAQMNRSGGQEARDFRWMLMVALIAAVIAVLSVFTVLRGVFLERQNNLRLLHRLGLSKRKIRLMYVLECGFIFLVQSAVGIALGLGGYCSMFTYQVKVLEKPDYSALTSDPLVLDNTRSPYLYALLFSAAVIAAAYLITALSTMLPVRSRITKKKDGSLFQNFSSVFRQRAMTCIQTASLTLICVGTLLGYIYYTDNGKTETYLDYTNVYTKATYVLPNGLDMETDGIAEYYAASPPHSGSIDSYGTGEGAFYTADCSYTSGMNDAAVAQFSGVTATGCLKQTFLVFDTPHTAFSEQILFPEQAEKDFIVQFSTEQYQNFFDAGQLGTKQLYRMETRLADPATLAKLSQFVVDGELHPEQLNAGREVLLVLSAPNAALQAGTVLHVGSAVSNNGAGIGGITEADITVGAIAVIPQDAEACLQYAALSKVGCNFLTTAQGAAAAGFHNASYTELFAAQEIDGGKIPRNANMQVTAYEALKRENFLKKATEYGGLGLIILLMSLLGFAAYFSGIGMKIRMKSYEISVMRALGTSVSRIRRRLFLDSLRLPLIATVLAGVVVKIAQKRLASAYHVIQNLTMSPAGEYLPLTEADDAKIKEMVEQYFVPNKCWVVSLEKPLLLLFCILCVITIVLTLIALRKFKRNIADTLNSGRERK